jgi:hypothetical protein
MQISNLHTIAYIAVLINGRSFTNKLVRRDWLRGRNTVPEDIIMTCRAKFHYYDNMDSMTPYRLI